MNIIKKKRSSMNEAVFNTEVINSFKKLGYWAKKWPDFPMSPQQDKSKTFRFNPIKPYDIEVKINHKSVSVEGKQLKKFEAFGINKMRPSQVDNFEEIYRGNNGRCFIFLNIRISTTNSYGLPPENRLIILEWASWRERLLAKISLSKKELEKFEYIQGCRMDSGDFDKHGKQIRKIMFDLTQFCEAIEHNLLCEKQAP